MEWNDGLYNDMQSSLSNQFERCFVSEPCAIGAVEYQYQAFFTKLPSFLAVGGIFGVFTSRGTSSKNPRLVRKLRE